MWRLVCVLLLLSSWCLPQTNAYGEPSSGRPSYQERTFISLLNAARVGPAGYRTTYMTGYTTTGALTTAAVAPLYMDPLLLQAARAHSTDLTTCHKVQLNSCNGTSWSTRVRAACTTGGVAETVLGTTSSDLLKSANDALCSWTKGSDGVYKCCPDGGLNTAGSACDGTRKLYLSVGKSRIGSGVAKDSTNNYYYWTSDFSTCNTETYTNFIASGSHILQSGIKTRFFASYWDAQGAPQSAQVVVSGAASNLALDTGVAGKGNYFIQLATGTGCRSYYFQFKSASGGIHRFPETGYFNTYGEGSCVTDWTSTAVDGSAATVPGVPQSVQVASITQTTATISWTAPATNGGSAVTGYTVSVVGGGQTKSYSVTTLSVSATGLLAGQTYTVKVTAKNAVGSGSASAAKSFITVAASPSPSTSPSRSPTRTPTPSPTRTPSRTPSSSPSKAASPTRSPTHTPSPTRSPTRSPSPSRSPTPSPKGASCSTAACLPASYNFHSQTGCFVGIMNQGSCGSCYAFSTAAAASDRLCYAQDIDVVLSPQEILDCGKGTVWPGATGCNGGYTYQSALLMASPGFPTSDTVLLTGGCRPYKCSNGTCSANPVCSTKCADGSTTTTKYKATTAARITGVQNMMLEIFNNGPIVATYYVCNSFYNFFADKSNAGKVFATDCSTSSSDYRGGHAVSVVGWGTDDNGVDFWLIANSWGRYWGDSGYFRIQRGVNMCNIESFRMVAVSIPNAAAKRFGAISEPRVARASAAGSEVSPGAPVELSHSSDYTLRSMQIVLDQWFLSNGGDSNNQSIDLSTNSPAPDKRQAGEEVPLSITSQSSFSVSSVNSATVQVTSGQSVFVDFVATDGTTTVNLASTVSYGTSGETETVAAITVGSSSSGLGAGAIAGIVVGSVVGALLLASLTVAAVAGTVVVVKKMKARKAMDEEKAVEMEDVSSKPNRSTWFTRRLMFQSITARSPPIKVSD